jgi:hypothetical protein
LEGADVAFFLAGNSGEPTNFYEAYNHPDPDARVKWRVAICKDTEYMKNKEVREVFPMETIPEGRSCLKIKWVLKIKRNRIFRVRLMACGYNQVPVIDFTESYAPVINGVSFRIIFIRMLVCNLKAKIFDIANSFLHGDLEVKYFYADTKWHGIGRWQISCLEKIIYEFVRSAKKIYVDFVKALKSCGFTGSLVDPIQD